MLPRDVEIPKLPGLGRTWYDRGPRYWAGRAGLSLLSALLLLLIGLIDEGLFGAMRRSSRTKFNVFIRIDAVVTAALLVWFAVRTTQQWNVPELPARPSQPVFRFGRGPSGQLLSSLAQLGWMVLIFVVAVAMLFFSRLVHLDVPDVAAARAADRARRAAVDGRAAPRARVRFSCGRCRRLVGVQALAFRGQPPPAATPRAGGPAADARGAVVREFMFLPALA